MSIPSRPPLDLSLYLVTDTALCGEYGVAATVAAAIRGVKPLKKQITAYQRFIVKYEGEWNGAQAPEKKEA